MSLTLGLFRELTKDLPSNFKINTTVEFGSKSSLRGIVNVLQIASKEYSHSNENYIVLTQDKGIEKNKVLLETLTDFNNWSISHEEKTF